MAEPGLGRAGVRPCKLKRTIDALEQNDPEHHERLMTALSDGRATDLIIANAVSSWGWRISDDAVRRHRRNECCCLPSS